jgi:hypothetical protein
VPPIRRALTLTRAENGWRWLCRVAGAVLLGWLVIEERFAGPAALYFLFAGLMTLGDVIAEALRLRREINELRQDQEVR